MDVGHVKGPGGVEPNAGRPELVRTDDTPAARESHADEASISKASQQALELERRVKSESGVRQEKVDAAHERLESGELDRPEVYEETARRILGDSEESLV